MQSKTTHAAKGLEAKTVFVIGLTEGSAGSPDIWLEDRIFGVIKKSQSRFADGRRKALVLLTRQAFPGNRERKRI